MDMKKGILIQETKDGSHTLYNESLDETYHSTHGAVQEANHVFIDNGIKLIDKSDINILEVGFGTGLNAILTNNYAKENSVVINYIGLETIPLGMDLINKLNYLSENKYLSEDEFMNIHKCDWEIPSQINDSFSITKKNIKIQNFQSEHNFDLVYYDAFGPRAQIEMWDRSIFENLFSLINHGGKLVTYCAMGQFKRDLKSVGFIVECVPGPPGKREMTIASKK